MTTKVHTVLPSEIDENRNRTSDRSHSYRRNRRAGPSGRTRAGPLHKPKSNARSIIFYFFVYFSFLLVNSPFGDRRIKQVVRSKKRITQVENLCFHHFYLGVNFKIINWQAKKKKKDIILDPAKPRAGTGRSGYRHIEMGRKRFVRMILIIYVNFT